MRLLLLLLSAMAMPSAGWREKPAGANVYEGLNDFNIYDGPQDPPAAQQREAAPLFEDPDEEQLYKRFKTFLKATREAVKIKEAEETRNPFTDAPPAEKTEDVALDEESKLFKNFLEYEKEQFLAEFSKSQSEVLNLRNKDEERLAATFDEGVDEAKKGLESVISKNFPSITLADLEGYIMSMHVLVLQVVPANYTSTNDTELSYVSKLADTFKKHTDYVQFGLVSADSDVLLYNKLANNCSTPLLRRKKDLMTELSNHTAIAIFTHWNTTPEYFLPSSLSESLLEKLVVDRVTSLSVYVKSLNATRVAESETCQSSKLLKPWELCTHGEEKRLLDGNQTAFIAYCRDDKSAKCKLLKIELNEVAHELSTISSDMFVFYVGEDIELLGDIVRTTQAQFYARSEVTILLLNTTTEPGAENKTVVNIKEHIPPRAYGALSLVHIHLMSALKFNPVKPILIENSETVANQSGLAVLGLFDSEGRNTPTYINLQKLYTIMAFENMQWLPFYSLEAPFSELREKFAEVVAFPGIVMVTGAPTMEQFPDRVTTYHFSKWVKTHAVPPLTLYKASKCPNYVMRELPIIYLLSDAKSEEDETPIIEYIGRIADVLGKQATFVYVNTTEHINIVSYINLNESRLPALLFEAPLTLRQFIARHVADMHSEPPTETPDDDGVIGEWDVPQRSGNFLSQCFRNLHRVFYFEGELPPTDLFDVLLREFQWGILFDKNETTIGETPIVDFYIRETKKALEKEKERLMRRRRSSTAGNEPVRAPTPENDGADQQSTEKQINEEVKVKEVKEPNVIDEDWD